MDNEEIEDNDDSCLYPFGENIDILPNTQNVRIVFNSIIQNL